MRPWLIICLAIGGCGLNEDDAEVVDSPLASTTAESLFVSNWRVAEDGRVVLPLPEGFAYDFTVDWGDESQSQVTSHDDPDASHVYAEAGTYIIVIEGLIEAWSFWRISDSKDQLVEIASLGGVGWKSFFGAFFACENLTVVSKGDVSAVTDMALMFADATSAIPETETWDTAAVINMALMFKNATSAQPQVKGWNTVRVQDMSYMFADTALADPDVSVWDTSTVRDMSFMFHRAAVADPDVRNWNTAAATLMTGAFKDTAVADPDVGLWNTSSVTSMDAMFQNAVQADPDVSCWNTANVVYMQDMFAGAEKANPDVRCWDVSRVINMENMFRDARSATPDMGDWNFKRVQKMHGMFTGVSLPVGTYSEMLKRLAETTEQRNVTLDGGNSKYDSGATVARNTLIKKGWHIHDLGVEK